MRYLLQEGILAEVRRTIKVLQIVWNTSEATQLSVWLRICHFVLEWSLDYYGRNQPNITDIVFKKNCEGPRRTDMWENSETFCEDWESSVDYVNPTKFGNDRRHVSYKPKAELIRRCAFFTLWKTLNPSAAEKMRHQNSCFSRKVSLKTILPWGIEKPAIDSLTIPLELHCYPLDEGRWIVTIHQIQHPHFPPKNWATNTCHRGGSWKCEQLDHPYLARNCHCKCHAALPVYSGSHASITRVDSWVLLI